MEDDLLSQDSYEYPGEIPKLKDEDNEKGDEFKSKEGIEVHDLYYGYKYFNYQQAQNKRLT